LHAELIELIGAGETRQHSDGAAEQGGDTGPFATMPIMKKPDADGF
jgi:hypothetical protein